MARIDRETPSGIRFILVVCGENSGRSVLFSFRPDVGDFSSPTEMRFHVMGSAFRTP